MTLCTHLITSSRSQAFSLTSKNLSSGSYIVQVTNGPYMEGMTANCTFQVVDPQWK